MKTFDSNMESGAFANLQDRISEQNPYLEPPDTEEEVPATRFDEPGWSEMEARAYTPAGMASAGELPANDLAASLADAGAQEILSNLVIQDETDTPTGAWPAYFEAEEVMSRRDWERFVYAEMERMRDQDPDDPDALMFDCADFGLYLLALYHKERGVELTYRHPLTGRTISSSEDYFSGEDGFMKFVFGDVNAKRNDYYTGLIGAFGPQHLYAGDSKVEGDYYAPLINGEPIAFDILDYRDVKTGDVGISTYHTLPVYTVTSAEENSIEYESVYASGSYYGPGTPEQNEKHGLGRSEFTPGENHIIIPYQGTTNVEPGGDYKMIRFSFLEDLPETRTYERIEPRTIDLEPEVLQERTVIPLDEAIENQDSLPYQIDPEIFQLIIQSLLRIKTQ